MKLMIIFLILSVVLLIGTMFYLNYKKKNITFTMQQNIKNEKGKKINKKQLSNILNIKIKGNVICLGNRYSNILKLGNIDYNMLSENEQSEIENMLMQTALSISYPIQFFSTTEFIETTQIIKYIKLNKANNLQIQKYKEQLIKYLTNLMESKNICVIKNYAIISSDGNYENAIEELNRNSMAFKSNLLRVNITCELLNEDDIYNLIYRELNKNSILGISKLKEGGENLYVGKKQNAKRNKYI